ncbi:MAG: transcriptional repressor [Dehalococcoidales bacterium]|jgi:Fe2+ or Zn2+ uptake regulation protein|nr:transcriptional repressor [Dehalococcoidales bacterium]MDP6501297.1 transcriptional repressor [Dehalococcoidales bacterium]MDP6632185.1 transcriptional repressor [Dehalococcoidales bacterium]
MTRKSKQKEAILKTIRGTTLHPTAEWIYEGVRKEIPNISLGTVYRNLRLLKREGVILELDLAGSISRFDKEAQNHYHFRCEQCDCIVDLDEAVNTELNERLTRQTGFQIFYHRLEFRGLCNGCQS